MILRRLAGDGGLVCGELEVLDLLLDPGGLLGDRVPASGDLR